MAKKVQIKGIDKITKNLNNYFEKLKEVSEDGLIRVGIMLRNDMDKSNPIVPRKTRNLQQSFFSVTKNKSHKGSDADSGQVASAKGLANFARYPILVMGFTADYAAAVHELGETGKTAGKTIKWSHPQSGALFFSKALERNKESILVLLGITIKGAAK
jgi:hypothetical protein